MSNICNPQGVEGQVEASLSKENNDFVLNQRCVECPHKGFGFCRTCRVFEFNSDTYGDFYLLQLSLLD